ncbi:rRNA adenine N-6-methyltransferase family protein, partial [Parabacteroides distasonis]|uniref:rRNA adenine N-6-methyltransferase family protein n=2 Tax=Parabacteroides distasonis TaxID=823 RepID=UPI0034A17B7E
MTKKKLPVRFTGQHFTIDKVLIKDAIRQANISNQDTVLDIGAGKGFLGSPDKPGGLSIQLCKSEKKEFYIRYS